MGVRECDRRDCENIMCDKYSDEFGYICYECLSELRELQTVKKLKFKDISEFMHTPKVYSNVVDIDDIFK